MSSFKNMFSFEPAKPATEIKDFEMPRFDTAGAPPGGNPRVESFSFAPFSFRDPRSSPGSPEDCGQDNTEQIIQQARKQAEQLQREAYEQGFAQGLKDGRREGEKSLASVIQNFMELISALETQKRHLYGQCEQEILQLTLLVARKIIDRELSLRPELICQVIQTASKYLSETEEVRLRLNPQDHHWLESHQEVRNPELSFLPHILLIPDNQVSPGGLILENQAGEIDLTLESRWAKVAAVIEDALSQAWDLENNP